MADFAAVLKKTIDAQADPTPELRQRVYDKARATIEQKLAAANAPAAVAAKQRKALEDAIAQIEAEYGPSPRASAASQPQPARTPQPKPAPRPVAPPAPAVPPKAAPRPVAPAPKPARVEPRVEPAMPDPEPRAPRRALAREPEPGPDPLDDFLKGARPASRSAAAAEPAPDFTQSRAPGGRKKPSRRAEPELEENERDEWQNDREEEESFARDPAYGGERRRSGRGLVYGLIALLLLGGAGYAAWSNQDQLQTYLANLMAQFEGEKDAAVQPAATTPPAQKPAPAPSNAGPSNNQPQAPAKLTQRLMPDGTEMDPGPAGDKPGVGEGTSVAEATSQAAPQPATGQTPQAAIPVGQQAFFYEERSGQEAGSAKKGSVVWSEVQDSPGDGEPAEPAIRADVTIPENNIKLRMTIRRNTDKSLPASHLIEMIFSVPQNFPGGAIDNVQRVTFKDTEQSAGSPLIAIPNKIADNLFIVALNDARTAIDTNMTLMRRQQWIDIPITYRTGRRALITVEKGVPGEKVFNDVLRAWGVGG
ncbi:transcriptional regulator [Brucella sp. IR073]|uniref:transcriptional regulator n=1 Tax=unclassified Brucella TaxID=2632610 RepID=UPI003B9841B0